MDHHHWTSLPVRPLMNNRLIACRWRHGNLLRPLINNSDVICPLFTHTNTMWSSTKKSLANANVSARQPWYIGFPKCEVAQSYKKIWTYSSSSSSKVIDLGANRKRICNFSLVTSSNFGRISYCFPLAWPSTLRNPREYPHIPYISRNYSHCPKFLPLIVWVYIYLHSNFDSAALKDASLLQ